MLHLAQVQRQEISSNLVLRLLARQEAEYTWVLVSEEVFMPVAEKPHGANCTNPYPLSEGLLILLELSPNGDLEHCRDATSWVLDLVQTYLSSGITPEFLRQEAERAEQWRQTLALQNQELARRSLEVEARREQIEALGEEGLKREKEAEP